MYNRGSGNVEVVIYKDLARTQAISGSGVVAYAQGMQVTLMAQGGSTVTNWGSPMHLFATSGMGSVRYAQRSGTVYKNAAMTAQMATFTPGLGTQSLSGTITGTLGVLSLATGTFTITIKQTWWSAHISAQKIKQN